jgi:glycosyltransferase involved in cell wall biosynthesis
MQQRGVKVTIAAPGEKFLSYEHNGLAVRRFPVSNEVSDIRDLYGTGDLGASEKFAEILDEERPDLVHLHAFTRGVSLRMVREAKRRGIKVVFTYHTPTVSCQRGTLMHWGAAVCDGVLDVRRCAACTLHGLGLNKTVSLALVRLPSTIGRIVDSAGLSGGMWTALRMTELVGLRHSVFRSLLQEVDRVVVLSKWTADVLTRNGMPQEKVIVSPNGLSPTAKDKNGSNCNGPALDSYDAAESLRIAFLGRWNRLKGPDILIRALRSLPNAALKLHLYGIVQSDDAGAYLQHLKSLAGDDPRIRFLPSIGNDRIVPLLRSYHLLAVPSRGIETRPLVVLEAFTAGIPVIGPERGGIAELVQHEINGILVESDSVKAWSKAIRRCYDDRAFLERLRRGVRPPCGMDVAAEEMILLYRQTLELEQISHEDENQKAHGRC